MSYSSIDCSVINYRTGCSGQSVSDNLVLAIEDNFPDVKVKEFRGRFGKKFSCDQNQLHIAFLRL